MYWSRGASKLFSEVSSGKRGYLNIQFDFGSFDGEVGYFLFNLRASIVGSLRRRIIGSFAMMA